MTSNKRGQETTATRHLRIIQDRYHEQQMQFDETVDEEDEFDDTYDEKE